MKFTKLVSSLAIVLALTACGKEKVSFDTLETNRANAKANAEYNAMAFVPLPLSSPTTH